jgi:hypothetical protein
VLLRRLAARAGGMPPRVLVLELVPKPPPLAGAFEALGTCGSPTALATL